MTEPDRIVAQRQRQREIERRRQEKAAALDRAAKATKMRDEVIALRQEVLALLKARGYPDFEEIGIVQTGPFGHGQTVMAGWTIYNKTWSDGALSESRSWGLTIQLLANGCLYYNRELVTPRKFLSFRPHHPNHRDDPFMGWQVINEGLRRLKAKAEALD